MFMDQQNSQFSGSINGLKFDDREILFPESDLHPNVANGDDLNNPTLDLSFVNHLVFPPDPGTGNYAQSSFEGDSPSDDGHFTSKNNVYSFGVVLLEMLTGRRSMDKNQPNGEHNLVEWARPHLAERRRFYRLLDPRLEGRFSIKGAQKALQLAAHCLSRDPKARPLMSEVVEALNPLPNLKDMASSTSYFRPMQTERVGSYPNARNGIRIQTGLSRNRQPTRSLSIPNALHASP